MTSAITLGVMAATLLLAGCDNKSPGSSPMPLPGSKPVALSDGSNTWYLGATIVNGTNVPATNVTIRVRTGEVSK